MHVGHGRELLVDQRRPLPVDGRQGEARRRRAAQQTRVNQFAAGETSGVVFAKRRDRSTAYRNDVGRRRTHVYE